MLYKMPGKSPLELVSLKTIKKSGFSYQILRKMSEKISKTPGSDQY